MVIRLNNKKYIFIFIVLLLICVIIFGGYKLYSYIRIKNAKIEVKLVDNLTMEFYDEKKISDFIISINGNIINDKKINSKIIGKQKVEFEFINNEGIKVPYEYYIDVVDTTAPIVWLNSTYTVNKGTKINLKDNILCGDNYDNDPVCNIEGIYNLDEVGKYPLTFRAVDSSGNETIKDFTLNVIENTNTSSGTNTVTEKKYTKFTDVVNKYKNTNYKVGIDVSSWQNDIDFNKIKDTGVQFIMIRVGYQNGIDGEYVLDKKFKQNISEVNRVGIPAGVYFYSYANSVEDAKKDAKWVLKQIKKYNIQYPISFDWEEWNNFNEYKLSFFGLTSMAEEFVNVVEEAGYEGMIYSSKSYLEDIWLPTDKKIWLAHYTNETDYKGDYMMWQLCNNGNIDGINTDVDIDILMSDKL